MSSGAVGLEAAAAAASSDSSHCFGCFARCSSAARMMAGVSDEGNSEVISAGFNDGAEDSGPASSGRHSRFLAEHASHARRTRSTNSYYM